MAVIMDTPRPTLPANYRPPGGVPYRVQNGDNWISVATTLGMDAKSLIFFNFHTSEPKFVNYYLKHNVGCTTVSPDGKNYSFRDASPGIIYIPSQHSGFVWATAPTAPAGPKQFPVLQTPQFGPRKISTRSAGGFIWAVRFQLPAPPTNDGFIVQELDQLQTGVTTTGRSTFLHVRFFEAWKVTAGQTTVDATRAFEQTLASFIASQGGSGRVPPGSPADPFNDFFFIMFPAGSRGSVTFLASAAFYEEPLPSTFVPNNRATGAGMLPSTLPPPPPFWKDEGLFRALKYEFDFTGTRSPASASNATLRTFTTPVGALFRTNPGAGDFTTHG
jgi:hypothetical protein